MEEQAEYKTAISGMKKFADEIKILRSYIDQTKQQLEAATKNLEIAQQICTHTFPDKTTAFVEIGATHKSIHECSICGLTTTA